MPGITGWLSTIYNNVPFPEEAQNEIADGGTWARSEPEHQYRSRAESHKLPYG